MLRIKMSKKSDDFVLRLIILVVLIGVLYFAIREISLEQQALSNLRIEIYDVSVSRIGLTSADLAIKLKFTNPTSHDTPSFEAKMDVYLNGIYVGQLVIPETKVYSNSYSFQSSVLTVSYSGGIEALLEGSFTVALHGRIYYKLLGIIPQEVSF